MGEEGGCMACTRVSPPRDLGHVSSEQFLLIFMCQDRKLQDLGKLQGSRGLPPGNLDLNTKVSRIMHTR